MASARVSLVFPRTDIKILSAAFHGLAHQPVVGAPRSGILKLMDTFDWALDRQDTLLLFYEHDKTAEAIFLGPRHTVVTDLRLSTIDWIDPRRLTEPVMSRLLLSAIDRSLIIQASTAVNAVRLDFFDSQGMAVVAAWLFEFPEIDRCSILLAKKRGHRKFGTQIEALIRDMLEGQGISPVTGADPFDVILYRQHRSKQDYQSRFALSLTPSTELCVAFGQALLQEQQRAKRNALWIGRHPDSEFLHDLRVAMRRTSSLVKMLMPMPMASTVEVTWLIAELKYFISVTSPVRDLENLAGLVNKISNAGRASPELELLDSIMTQDLETRYRELSELIGSPRFEHFILSWGRLARDSLALSLGSALPANLTGFESKVRSGNCHLPPRSAVSDSARLLLLRSGRSLTRKAKKARPSMTPESLHALRKQAKTIRYLLEFYESVLDPRAVSKSIEAMKRLQDALGQHQDSHVQAEQLESLCKSHSMPKESVQIVFDVLERNKRAALKNFATEIELLSGRRLSYELESATTPRRSSR